LSASKAIRRNILLIFVLLFLLGSFMPGCSALRSFWVEEEPDEAVDPEIPEVVDPFEDEAVVADDEYEEEQQPGGDDDSGAPDQVEADDEDTGVDQPPAGESGGAVDLPLLVIADGDYLMALVVKDTTLKSDYVPPDLQPVPAYMKPAYSMQLRARALEHLENLYQAAADDGVELAIRSAYRSYSTQKGLFEDYARRYGEEEANRFSARPGQSEHQLGTTVDFGGTSVDFKAAYGETPQGQWLAENAWRFGFAMSYPAGKEHITGYIFEPWHYRYIGVDAAAEWRSSGKTLKEFLESKPQYYE
jgi:LAS superfamily LD-carboxypeptidase LdcB